MPHYVTHIFFTVSVWQYVPEKVERSNSIFSAGDGHAHTCHEVTKSDLEKSPLALVLPHTSSPNAAWVKVLIKGSNLYCETFDKTCSRLATQLYTRSFRDDSKNPHCSPFCGTEVSCPSVSDSSTRDLCKYSCTCPSGGCNEFIFMMHAGALINGTAAKVCEIVIQ